MKTMLSAAILLSTMLFSVSSADAQTPSMLELARDVDRAATAYTDKKESFLGFKKLEMPKPLQGLLDIRFKKPQLPQLPKFGFLEKLKNIGKPQFQSTVPSTEGPIMAGLSKLFPPRNPATPSLLDRMLGKSSVDPNASSLFTAKDMNELTEATKGLQEHVGRMSREVKTNASDLFTGQRNLVPPQPPLRSARQHSGQTESRF